MLILRAEIVKSSYRLAIHLNRHAVCAEQSAMSTPFYMGCIGSSDSLSNCYSCSYEVFLFFTDLCVILYFQMTAKYLKAFSNLFSRYVYTRVLPCPSNSTRFVLGCVAIFCRTMISDDVPCKSFICDT